MSVLPKLVERAPMKVVRDVRRRASTRPAAGTDGLHRIYTIFLPQSNESLPYACAFAVPIVDEPVREPGTSLLPDPGIDCSYYGARLIKRARVGQRSLPAFMVETCTQSSLQSCARGLDPWERLYRSPMIHGSVAQLLPATVATCMDALRSDILCARMYVETTHAE